MAWLVELETIWSQNSLGSDFILLPADVYKLQSVVIIIIITIIIAVVFFVL
jgi:hypothetical protein